MNVTTKFNINNKCRNSTKRVLAVVITTRNMETDNNKCEKCGGRTAIVSGQWVFNPDSEPYLNGKEEDAITSIDEGWINGEVCDDCSHIQNLSSE